MSYRVPVVSTEQLPESMILLTLDTSGTPLAKQYEHAGQFVTLSTPHSPPGFFSMASSPGDSAFDFLIKVEAENPKTAEIAKLTPGSDISVSDVDGPGYPLDEQRGRNLLLVATGTGIAPLRALLCDIRMRRDHFALISMVYGAVNEEALAFRDEWRRWADMQVELKVVLSRPSPSWKGPRGYVQDIVREMDLDTNATTAFLCGQKAMTGRVAEILRGRGVDPGRILENR